MSRVYYQNQQLELFALSDQIAMFIGNYINNHLYIDPYIKVADYYIINTGQTIMQQYLATKIVFDMVTNNVLALVDGDNVATKNFNNLFGLEAPEIGVFYSDQLAIKQAKQERYEEALNTLDNIITRLLTFRNQLLTSEQQTTEPIVVNKVS